MSSGVDIHGLPEGEVELEQGRSTLNQASQNGHLRASQVPQHPTKLVKIDFRIRQLTRVCREAPGGHRVTPHTEAAAQILLAVMGRAALIVNALPTAGCVASDLNDFALRVGHFGCSVQ
jgi:hypothetical protein